MGRLLEVIVMRRAYNPSIPRPPVPMFVHNLTWAPTLHLAGLSVGLPSAGLDRMGVALVFCLLCIVVVVGLYLCFWVKVERARLQDNNRLKIKVLEKKVDKLTRKVLWVEGRVAVTDCENRDSHTPPPRYTVVEEQEQSEGEVLIRNGQTALDSCPLPHTTQCPFCGLGEEEFLYDSGDH